MRILKVISCGLLLVLCGCWQSTPLTSVSREAESATPTDTAVVEEKVSQELPGGLTLEAHLLTGTPEFDSLIFTPVKGTQEEILAVHGSRQSERSVPRYNVNSTVFLEDRSLRSIEVLGTPFSAVEISHYTSEGSIEAGDWGEREVQVLQGDEIIYSISAGENSSRSSFQGLWAYGEHWALEVAHVTMQHSPDSNAVLSEVEGQLIVDGMLLNDVHDYDEAFNFYLIAERPFYFFERDGSIGISYAGREADLGYTDVTHYQCCSAALANPDFSEDMVSFFAQHEGMWYYVEIGIF